MIGLLKGLKYLADLDIVHRDLKPYNILYKYPVNFKTLHCESATLTTPRTVNDQASSSSTKSETVQARIEKLSRRIKIIDFGLATYIHDNEIYSKCGTPGFLAPELFGESEEV